MIKTLFRAAVLGSRPRERAAVDWQAVDVLIFALGAFMLLYGLGDFGVRDINEGLYAEIAREMLDSGDWIVPHLNGVLYLEKPPLLYWLVAFSFHIFGEHEFAARLPGALSLLGLGILLRSTLGPSSRLALVLLFTSLPVVVLGRALIFDPLLTALEGAHLLLLYKAVRLRDARALRLSAVFLGLALLCKGPVALALSAGILALYLLQRRERGTLVFLLDGPALLIVMLVALPWHLAVVSRVPGFELYYLINENVLRFFGMREPADFHTGSVFYYLPLLPGMVLPWTPLLLLVAARLRHLLNRGNPLTAFCLAWIVWPLIFFSLSRAKGQYYLLVAAPALAILLARELRLHLRCRPLQRPAALALLACLGLAVAVCVLAALWPVNEWRRFHPDVSALAVLAASTAILPGLSLTREQARRALWQCLGASLVACVLLMSVVHELSPRHSQQELAHYLVERFPHAKVFLYRHFEDYFSSLPFYLRQHTPVVDSSSADLQMGCAHAPRLCPSMVQFQDHEGVVGDLLVVRSEELPLAKAGLGDRAFRLHRFDADTVLLELR